MSCWGGVSEYKLQSLFSLQKRCVRLLFGNVINFDHPEFYESCARVRTYKEHIAAKNFQHEHTKLIFNEQNLLILHHLYIYHTFCETFKLIKYRTPISLFSLLQNSPSDTNMLLMIPKVNLDLQKKNFIFQASCIWNSINKKVFNQCLQKNKNGVLIPGSTFGSDIATPISVIKRNLRDVLLETQNSDALNSDDWLPANFYQAHYPVYNIINSIPKYSNSLISF